MGADLPPIAVPVVSACTARAGPTSDYAPEATTYDVIVVGGGPSGSAAALAALESGASVRLFERASSVRGSLGGVHAMGVGTRWQEEAGVTDSVDLAVSEWSSITGVDGESAGVRTFLQSSAATLERLESFGVVVSLSKLNSDAGSRQRIHDLDGSVIDFTDALDSLGAAIQTDVTVTGPMIDGAGHLCGVTWHDDVADEDRFTSGRSVVVATGGFLRDMERVLEWRPDLAGRDLVYETDPKSDGGGLPFLELVDAGWENQAGIGLYAHGTRDPSIDGDEALLLSSLKSMIYVNEEGERFANESLTSSLGLFQLLPETGAWEVLPMWATELLYLQRPGYNGADGQSSEVLTFAEAADQSEEVWGDLSLEDLASAAGINAVNLARTIDEYNQLVAAHATDSFGRDLSESLPLEDETWAAIRIYSGLAKAYGGVATDIDGHVLNGAGRTIPGLFAAGEVAGMILGGGAGTGFNGSLTACWAGGFAAGQSAADEAIGR